MQVVTEIHAECVESSDRGFPVMAEARVHSIDFLPTVGTVRPEKIRSDAG
jgi:hypothetical protein